jgi:hypothetical protein
MEASACHIGVEAFSSVLFGQKVLHMAPSGSPRSKARPRLTGVLAAVLLAAGVATTIPARATTAVDLPQLRGVQLHSLWSANTTSDVDQQLDLVAASGSSVARLDVAWSSLQLTARYAIDSGYAARLDRAVAGATARGVKLILTVTETPCWASSAPDTLKLDCTGSWWDRKVTKYAPNDPADYAWIVNWIAAKYGQQLAAIELWNEPNYVQGDFFNFMAPDIPLAYTRLVQAAYPAIKSVAPSLPVLAGALSFSDDVFLRALYADGIQGSYDGLSTHPYNEGRAPGAPHDSKYYKYDLVQGTDAIRAARAAAGDTTPLWFTEFGYTSCTVGTNSWCVTPDQQATYLADATRLVAGWADVRAFVLYNLRNKGTSATSTEANFGLVTTTYERKPAYAAVSDVFHALAAAPAPVVIATTITAGDSAVVVYPAVSTIHGRLLDDTGTAVAGQSVVVLQRTAGTTAWLTAGRATSAADGSVTWSGTSVSSDWQLRFDGAPGLAASTGPVVSAPVATAVSLKASATKLQLNAFLTLTGSVAPAHAGQPVYADVWTGATWTQVASTNLSSTSTYSTKFKVTTRGALAYRVRKPADVDHAAGTSPSVSVSVL